MSSEQYLVGLVGFKFSRERKFCADFIVHKEAYLSVHSYPKQFFCFFFSYCYCHENGPLAVISLHIYINIKFTRVIFIMHLQSTYS